MKKSLKKKLCVTGVLLIAGFVLLNIILTYFLLIPFSIYLNEIQMEKIALAIEEHNDYSGDEFENYIEELDEDMNTQITIINGKKEIIATTSVKNYKKNEIGETTQKIFKEKRSEIENGEVVSYAKNKEDLNKIVIKVIKKIADDRYVIINRSHRSLQNATYSAVVFEIIAGVILIILSAVVIYRLSVYLVVPIQDMTNAAEHISNLEFDLKVQVKTQDEIGKLGNSINKMSDHMEQSLEKLQMDIESRKNLLRNLSHEIKSPIAVIMGYADRLKVVMKKNPEKAISYCEIISSESARIDKMVKEMLELSRLESNHDTLQRERIDAKDFFDDLKRHFHEDTMERNIQYQDEYGREDVFYADYNLLERAVYNLIKNATAYGAPENLLIRVSGKNVGEYYEFSVFNTGSFVQEEHAEALWQAFTKEDKARTRNKGYGVGLAIVREIVEAHEGYYSVKNVEDGVLFCIAIKTK